MSTGPAEGSLRRAAVLGLVALALGLVAVRSVAQREAALRTEIGPSVRLVVAAREVAAGATLSPQDLAYRQMPARFAPPRLVERAEDALGLRAVVRMDRGTPLTGALLSSPAQQARAALDDGDRVVELLAAGSVRIVRPGSRVDVVATRTGSDGRARSRVLAAAIEVIDVRGREGDGSGDEQVIATLRAGPDDALKLATAQDGDQALRILPRAAWDR